MSAGFDSATPYVGIHVSCDGSAGLNMGGCMLCDALCRRPDALCRNQHRLAQGFVAATFLDLKCYRKLPDEWQH
jgi:hypothetical protein